LLSRFITLPFARSRSSSGNEANYFLAAFFKNRMHYERDNAGSQRPESDKPLFFVMQNIPERQRKRIIKNQYGSFKPYAMTFPIQHILRFIPLKAHGLNLILAGVHTHVNIAWFVSFCWPPIPYFFPAFSNSSPGNQ
jgi:hypothetical protein